jgi:hypothetical protein
MLRNLSRMGRGLLFILVLATPALAGWVRPSPAPELDPGSMASAVTLLVGGLLILRDRRRRK